MIMVGVREYCEGYDVVLTTVDERLVVKAWNEARFNSTEVDLLDLLTWLRANRPELLVEVVND